VVEEFQTRIRKRGKEGGTILGAFLDYANDWKEFVREFGEPEEVS
jgi:hypothetical protein